MDWRRCRAEEATENRAVHDAARPSSDPALIARAIDAAGSRAAAPGVPLADTIKIDVAARWSRRPNGARLPRRADAAGLISN